MEESPDPTAEYRRRRPCHRRNPRHQVRQDRATYNSCRMRVHGRGARLRRRHDVVAEERGKLAKDRARDARLQVFDSVFVDNGGAVAIGRRGLHQCPGKPDRQDRFPRDSVLLAGGGRDIHLLHRGNAIPGGQDHRARISYLRRTLDHRFGRDFRRSSHRRLQVSGDTERLCRLCGLPVEEPSFPMPVRYDCLRHNLRLPRDSKPNCRAHDDERTPGKGDILRNDDCRGRDRDDLGCRRTCHLQHRARQPVAFRPCSARQHHKALPRPVDGWRHGFRDCRAGYNKKCYPSIR